MTLEELMKKQKAEKEAKQAQQTQETQTVQAATTTANVTNTQTTAQTNVQETTNKTNNETNNNAQNVQNEQVKQTNGSEDAQATYEDEKDYDVKKFIGKAESKFQKPLLDEELYNAELIEITDMPSKNYLTGKDEIKYVWKFKLISDMMGNPLVQDKNGKTFEKGIILSLWNNIAFGPKSKNYHLYSQIMKKEPELGSEYDLKDCLGHKCRIMTKTVKSKKDGTAYSVIDKVCQAK